jgi:hypothetical protein
LQYKEQAKSTRGKSPKMLPGLPAAAAPMALSADGNVRSQAEIGDRSACGVRRAASGVVVNP